MILPLLCSAIHAILAIGVRIEDLFSAVHTLESQVANSLVDQELRDLRNTVGDQSHRVAPSAVRAPPSQTPLPQQGSRQAPSRPNVVPDPTVPIPFSYHRPHPRSYADVIHGGTSELDQATADNAARRKGKAKPKTQSSGTSGVKVADAVEAASPKGPPPLPSASRRFYAPRTVQAPYPDEALIRIRWPDLAASVLREANSDLPLAFKTFVNDKGAVSLVSTDTAVPAACYAPFFEALSLKLNESFPVGNNPWLPFRLTRLISNLPSMASHLTPSQTTTTSSSLTFNPPYTIPRTSSLEAPDTSTLIPPPAGTARELAPSWFMSLLIMLTEWSIRPPSSFMAATVWLKEPTHRPPLPSAATAGSLAMSSPGAKTL